MIENDTSMNNYDIKTLKKNLDSLRIEKGLTQIKFGEYAGIDQSRVCNILNTGKKDCVTVEQLARIALAFHVSVDDLLGIAPAKEQEQPKEKKAVTIAAIFEKLFEIDDMYPLHICPFSNEAGQGWYAVYFTNEELDCCLKQWSEIKSISTSFLTQKRIEQLWKADLLKNYSDNREEWEFRTRYAQEYYLASLLTKLYKENGGLLFDLPFDLTVRENVDMLNRIEPDSDIFDIDGIDTNTFYAALKELSENGEISDF